VFTEGEIAYCRRRSDPAPHFAARFAAKEAGFKALGTGLRLGVRWRELEVCRDGEQAPDARPVGALARDRLFRGGKPDAASR